MLESRDHIRQKFCDVWHNVRAQAPLDALETVIRDVLLEHPEYQGLVEDKARALGSEYTPEQGQTNPFLHMGMHISLQEQITTDRPKGIRAVYSTLMAQGTNGHEVEHKMMDCLGQALWAAQRNGSLPDEDNYLNCLQKIRS